jgi:hypothetical protein
MTRIMGPCKTERNLSKRVPLTGGGFSTAPDGTEEILYEVFLDGCALNGMARKAAGSKGQMSTDGPLTVKVISRKRI